MGFNIPFYIIFGTNLLTKGPVKIAVLLPISVFRRKGISNGIQTERNLHKDLSWNKRNPGDLEYKSGSPRSFHEAGARPGGVGAPHPRGPHGAPPTYFFRLYIPMYPKNIQESHETTFPPPQPPVPMRSHLGPFPAICQRGIRSRRLLHQHHSLSDDV